MTNPIEPQNLNFFEQLEQFNKMYSIPEYKRPTLDITRLENFEKILREEVNEFNLVTGDNKIPLIDVIVNQADLYADIIIYCASELRRIGFKNPQAVLDIIMRSNFSKMGADGKPIFDERGKLMKGPNYWKPEPMIAEYITQLYTEHNAKGN